MLETKLDNIFLDRMAEKIGDKGLAKGISFDKVLQGESSTIVRDFMTESFMGEVLNLR